MDSVSGKVSSVVGLLGLAVALAQLKYQKPSRRPSDLKPPLEVWYPSLKHESQDKTEIDIIAVHGLDSDVDSTWTYQSEDGLRHVNWLSDPGMLPRIVPKARIMVSNDVVKIWLGDYTIFDIERPNVLSFLSAIALALIFANRRGELQYLTENTVGCIFLGTPFRGSRSTGFQFRQVSRMLQPTTINNLTHDYEELTDTMHEFTSLVQNTPMSVVCFYEVLRTRFGTRFGIANPLKEWIVPEESATLPGWRRLGLLADHRSMNKFSGPDDQSFLSVSAEIRNMYENRNVALRQSKLKREPYFPHFLVPFGRNEHFVGRQAIIEELLLRIPPDTNLDNCQRTALEGLGGIGKTQIALEVAYQLRNKDPQCSIFWVSAESLTSFESDYSRIAQLFGLSGNEHDLARTKSLVKTALSQEDRSKWLLIIDNADDLDVVLDGPSLVQFLPFSRNGSILFTTRNHQAAVGLGARTINVGSMELHESITLLGLDAKQEPVDTESQNITSQLVNDLGHLPLAISQAAAYMNNNQITSSQYLQMLRSNDDNKINLLSKDFEAHGRYMSDPNPVTSTFFVSFSQLERSNPLGARYLQLASFLNANDIPNKILPLAEGQIEMMQALGRLKAFAFIQQRDEHSFDMHQLVQLSARRWIMNNGNRNDILGLAIAQLLIVLPDPDVQNRSQWARYLPHVLSLWRLIEKSASIDDLKIPQLMNKTGTWLSKMGRNNEAEMIFYKILTLQKRDLGAEHPETLLTMNNYAAVLLRQGRYEEATGVLSQVLDSRRKRFGDKYPDVLSSMNNLAYMLEATGRLHEASLLQEEVLVKRQQLFGLDHSATLLTMNNLAVICFKQGKVEEAMTMLTRVLATRSKILGENHSDVVSSMSSLAYMYTHVNRLDEALVLQEKVFDKRKRIFGEEHPNTIVAMIDLARSLFEKGRVEEAIEMSQKALEKLREILGEDHHAVISTIRELSVMLRANGRIEEAEELQREAGNIMKQNYGSELSHRKMILDSVVNGSEYSKIEQETEVSTETYD
ncbi:hypothetical protein MMC25_006155 [Agyrium rufum]|nr:hypothetical protein [Agyrium rufum]